MIIYVIILIGCAGVAFAAGVFLGRELGAANQKKRSLADEIHQVALRFNAKVDLDGLRDRADQIVTLANEIQTKAKTAQDTVYKELGIGPKIENLDNASSYITRPH